MDRSRLTLLRLNGRVVDFQRGSVTDASDRVVMLRPQAAEVLSVLAARPGVLVTKDELMQAVWPDIAVTDDSLVQCIAEIRKALGDENRQVIVTHVKRGYVLEPGGPFLTNALNNAGVTAVTEMGPTTVMLRRLPALALVLVLISMAGTGAWIWWDRTDGRSLARAAALSDRPSIAVRPFQALGDDATTQRFAAGISEDIIADLGRHSSLYVIASNSSSAYGSSVSSREVSRELGVRYVLEGSLQTDPKRIRITAQLVDGATGAQLWSERYDRPLDQLFDARDEVTAQIVATLLGIAGPIAIDGEKVARRKPPASLDAYDNYILGAAAYRRRTAQDRAQAQRLFERAVMLDPGFARAYAALAWVQWDAAFLGYGEDPAMAWREFHGAARKAAEADVNDGKAQLVLGMSYFIQDNTSLGAAAWDKALSLSPNDTAVIRPIGTQLPIALGVERAAEGVELVERALRLDPLHPAYDFMSLGVTTYFAARYDEAAMALEKVPDPDVEVRVMLALSYAMAGRTDDATGQVNKVFELDPEFSAEAWVDKDFYQPGGTSAALFFDGARKAGLPLCATASVTDTIDPRNRLPECTGTASTK